MNTLAIRNGEVRIYHQQYPKKFDGYVYAVMLVEIPMSHGPVDYSSPYTVICAQPYYQHNGAWGWVHLDSETKDTICGDLVKHTREGWMEPGKWVYLELLNIYT